MGNAQCKCCDSESKTQAEVVPMDVAPGGGGAAVGALALPSKGSERSLASSAPSTPRIASNLSREEIVKKLEEGGTTPRNAPHVQAVVRHFIRDLRNGVEAELLAWQGEDTIERQAATVSLDKSAQLLNVTSKDGSAVCPLSKIKEVYQMEDGANVFPVRVVDKLAQEDYEKLFMVHYEMENGEKRACILLASSFDGKCRFVNCLRILNVHAQKTEAGGDAKVLSAEAASAGSRGSTPMNSPRSGASRNVSRASPRTSPANSPR